METSNRKLKVYLSEQPVGPAQLFSKLTFDIAVVFCEPIFEYTDVLDDADIVPVDVVNHAQHNDNFEGTFRQLLKHLKPTQVLVDCGYTQHIGEGHSSNKNILEVAHKVNSILGTIEENHRPSFVMLGINRELKSRDKELHDLSESVRYTDFLWNRQYCFFEDQPDKIFTHTGRRNNQYPLLDSHSIDKDYYCLSDLDKCCEPDYYQRFFERGQIQKYLSPCKYRDSAYLNSEKTGFYISHKDIKTMTSTNIKWGLRDAIRKDLLNHLKHWPGFYSDSAYGNILVSQGQKNFESQLQGDGGADWAPIHNAYYEQSVISIYIETVTSTTSLKDKVSGLTEKTWNPIVKGHFIMPFGYCGIITDIKDKYGIQLPPFIDYSYDTYENDLERWFAYKQCVTKTLNISSEELWKYKTKYKRMLIENRQTLLDGYRDSVLDALKDFVCNNDIKSPSMDNINWILEN